MNDVYQIYIEGKPRGLDYNPMYKFNSIQELVERVESNDNVPAGNELVIEGWRMDNLIILGKTFADAYKELKTLFYDMEDGSDYSDL